MPNPSEEIRTVSRSYGNFYLAIVGRERKYINYEVNVSKDIVKKGFYNDEDNRQIASQLADGFVAYILYKKDANYFTGGKAQLTADKNFLNPDLYKWYEEFRTSYADYFMAKNNKINISRRAASDLKDFSEGRPFFEGKKRN